VSTTTGLSFCDNGCFFYRSFDNICILDDETPCKPIVDDVLELDRAIQGEIARAFGTLLAGVKSATRPTNQYADTDLALALARTRNILHVCMGGRIPDFSSTNEES
jgi:hypothetical protein